VRSDELPGASCSPGSVSRPMLLILPASRTPFCSKRRHLLRAMQGCNGSLYSVKPRLHGPWEDRDVQLQAVNHCLRMPCTNPGSASLLSTHNNHMQAVRRPGHGTSRPYVQGLRCSPTAGICPTPGAVWRRPRRHTCSRQEADRVSQAKTNMQIHADSRWQAVHCAMGFLPAAGCAAACRTGTCNCWLTCNLAGTMALPVCC
jgi:hypothetical protein